MMSSICWHVYGLVYRADKNYAEASKCYLQAMKLDRNNLQILRDYSLLQMHMRNYEPYIEAAHQLLNSKPSNKAFWIGLAVAYHLTKNYELALKIFNSYHESLTTEVFDFETSESYLYRNRIIEDSNDLEACLKDLIIIEPKILDRTSWLEAKGMIALYVKVIEQS